MESFKILFFLFFSCCLQNFCQNAKINTRPIIGILDQPASDDLKPYGSRVLVASYVKWLESSGARVVPVRYDASKVELKSIFNSINGLLLPGGGIEKFDNTTFYEVTFFNNKWKKIFHFFFKNKKRMFNIYIL